MVDDPPRFNHWKSRCSSARHCELVGQSGEEHLDRVQDDPLAPIVFIAWPNRMNRPRDRNPPSPRSRCGRGARSPAEEVCGAPRSSRSTPIDRGILGQLLGALSNDMKTPARRVPALRARETGLPEASCRNRGGGPPHTRVARLRGKPPPVISSSPVIPVGALGSERLRRAPHESLTFPHRCGALRTSKGERFNASTEFDHLSQGGCRLTLRAIGVMPRRGLS